MVCQRRRPPLRDLEGTEVPVLIHQPIQCAVCKRYPQELQRERDMPAGDRILVCEECRPGLRDMVNAERAARMKAAVIQDTGNLLLSEHSGRQTIIKTYGETTDILAQLLIKMIGNGHPPDVLSRQCPDGDKPVIRMEWLGTQEVRDYGYTARRYDLCMDIFNSYWNTAKFVGRLSAGD